MSYFKPNTKRAIKIATAIKSLTATVATTTYVMASAEWTLVVVMVGAVANEAINFLSDHENPNTLV